MLWMILLAPFAGLLSTVAGMGGGLLLVLLGSLFLDPRAALALTAPALLLGNLHRLFLFRDAFDRRVAFPFMLGAIPGALLGGAVVGALPPLLLRLLLVGVTLLALGRALARNRGASAARGARLRSAFLAPAGLLAGGIAGTAGAATIVAPTLLSFGLEGRIFLATAAGVASAMHISRSLAYGATGLLEARLLPLAAALGLALMLGNTLGARLRPRIGARSNRWITHGVLVCVVTLSLLGLGS